MTSALEFIKLADVVVNEPDIVRSKVRGRVLRDARIERERKRKELEDLHLRAAGGRGLSTLAGSALGAIGGGLAGYYLGGHDLIHAAMGGLGGAVAGGGIGRYVATRDARAARAVLEAKRLATESMKTIR